MINAHEILHTSLEEALSIIYCCQNVASIFYGILQLGIYQQNLIIVPSCFVLKYANNIIKTENKGDGIDNYIFYEYIWKPEEDKLYQDYLQTQDCLNMYNQFMSSVINMSDNQHICKTLPTLQGLSMLTLTSIAVFTWCIRH